MSSGASSGVKYTTQKSYKNTVDRDRPKHSDKIGAVGGPKKGGGGSKFVWGRPGDEVRYQDALHPDDPNYEEKGGETEVQLTFDWELRPTADSHLKFATSLRDFARFKSRVKTAANEYKETHVTSEFIKVVRELDQTVYHQDLPYILIKQSFDFTEAQREKIASLILALYKEGFLSKSQLQSGMYKLYNSLSDLLIDCPTAQAMLSTYVKFFLASGLMEAQVIDHLETNHQALNDNEKVNQLKQKIDSIIREYFLNEEWDELKQNLKELNAEFMHAEFVKRLVSLALDKGNRQREAASYFLANHVGDLIKHEHAEHGFVVLLQRVEDLSLDVPDILRLLAAFVARAVVDEVIPPAFLVRADLAESDLGSQVVQLSQSWLDQKHAATRISYVWEEFEDEEEQRKAQAEFKELDVNGDKPATK